MAHSSWLPRAIGLATVLGCVTTARAAGAALPAYLSAQADSPALQNISGVWWAQTYTGALQPEDGSAVPFTPAGKSMYDQILKGRKSGKLVDFARHTCLPQGTPRIMTTAYPFMIVQTPGQVSMIFEENRMYRTVRLVAKHADTELWDPSFMGESIGHWDGDTLAVDTTNFKSTTFLDDAGLPHSDKLDVTEQLGRPAGGNLLQDRITVTDPAIYTHPWTARLTYAPRPNVAIMTDWVCGERHRDIAAVKVAPKL